MKNSAQSQRGLRWSAAFLLLALTALPARASSHKSESWARSQFATAERMREALNGRPAQERTRQDYHRVISAYRQVYYGAPVSTKADPSVVAVADLMVEMGRRFNDDDILRSAIGQYEFLRREYPGSQGRFDALFTIGEIYQDDLNDPSRARDAFQEFLRRYPRHHLAEEARQQLDQQELQAARAKDAAANAKDADDAQARADADTAAKDSGDSQVNDFHQTTAANPGKLPRVTGIRHWSTPDYTRVAIELEQGVTFKSQRIGHPDRIVFDLPDTKLASTMPGNVDVDDGFLKKIRVAQFERKQTRVVLEVDDQADYNAFWLSNPPRLIIDVRAKGVHGEEVAASAKEGSLPVDAASVVAPAEDVPRLVMGPSLARADAPPTRDARPKSEPQVKVTDSAGVQNAAVRKKIVEADNDNDDDDSSADAGASPAQTTGKSGISPASERTKLRLAKSYHEAQPTAHGDRSLIRALGLKIGKIVIDPGHGGYDTGTIGPNGLEEKDLVLDVCKRLGKLLEERLGAEVEYTRRDDIFVPLESRTAIANQDQADLFVSVHANSSSDSDARGVETYYLNFTSSTDALEVAARENAVSEKSIHELQDLVKKIALKEKIEESREFATDVESALHTGLAVKNPGLRDRGVKKAPFIVLIGANMPSILAEISFVSNPDDERRLRTSAYRQRIAESLYHGIAKYVTGLGGVKVASRTEKGGGQ